MNRIYRLVWNRALRVLQVASELTHSHTGSSVESRPLQPRCARHPLFLACTAALTLAGAGLALPAWAAPATYTVTETTDDGTGALGTLSWAINQANNSPDSTIVIALTGGGTTVIESGTLPPLSASTTLLGTLQLAGPGGTPLRVSEVGTLQIGSSNDSTTGSIIGSSGSAGGGTDVGSAGGGSNGSGAVAVTTGATLNVLANGSIKAGAGGTGGDVTTAGVGGNGGAGGAGVTSSGSFTLTNAGTIAGGAGGAGGGSSGSGIGGNGGAGGTAVNGTGFNLTNSGTIAGGAGGAAGLAPINGNGGMGGTAVNGSGFTLTNAAAGQITGGSGGGTAVVSTGNSTVINAGSISGGTAVNFSGGGNTLTLHVGSTTTGNIVSTSGSTNGGDTLTLGDNASGGGSDSLDIGTVSGFTTHKKTGTSTWILTGTTTAVTPWTINGGTLSVSSDSNLGATSGGLTLNGGTLQNTAALTTSRAITLGSSGGTLQASGSPLTLNGAIDGSGDLWLSGSGNVTFGKTVKAGSLSANNTGDVTLTGNVTTARGQTYTSAVTLGGTNILTGTDISLAGGVTGAGYGLTITGNTTLGTVSGLASLSVSGTSLLNGDVTTTGGQTYAGAVILGGNTALTSTANGTMDFASTLDGTHDLVISTGGAARFVGAIGGTATLSKLDVTAGTFNANELNVNGPLSVTTTAGNITQGTGVFQVSGTSTFDAGTGAITLTNAGNDFTGAVNLTGGAIQITDQNALTLGTVNTGALTIDSIGALNLGSGTVDGSLSALSNNGTISTSGALAVSGASIIDAGNGAITLTDPDNDFQAGVSLKGTSMSLTDANDLSVTSLNSGANGSISLVAGGTLTLPTGSLSTGTGNLELASNGGMLSTTGALSGHNVSLTGHSGVFFGDVSATGMLTLGSTNSAVTASGKVKVDGNATISAGTGAITLTDAGNDFTGTVNLTGGATQISDINALTLGAVNTGALTLDSIGALNLGSGTVDGSLSALSNNGTISTSGALAVSGTSTINAGTGAITLTDAGNDFTGAVNLTGGTTQITDINALTLGAVNTGALTIDSIGALNLGSGTVDGNLYARSNNGTISTSGALAVSSTSTISAGTGAITLTNAGNDFNGTVNLDGGATQITDINTLTLGAVNTGALTLDSIGALNLGSGTVDGSLSALSNNGTISTSGALAVSGASTIDAGTGAIMLTNAGNDFTGAVNLTGGATQITDSNALTLGAVNTGALTVNSGNLTLSSSLVSSTTMLTSTGSISGGVPSTITTDTLIGSSAGDTTLAGANHVDTLGSFSAANFTLSNAQTLTVSGPLTTTGNVGNISLTTTSGALSINTDLTGSDVSLSSASSLALTNNISATTATLESQGNLAQTSGILSVGTLSGHSTGGTTVAGANQINTLGNFSAANFALSNAQALTVAAGSTVDGGSSASLATASGNLTINGTVSAALVSLKSAGSMELAGGAVLSSGGDLSLDAASSMALDGSMTAAGMATLNSAGVMLLDGSLTANNTLVQSGTLVVGSATGSGAALGGNLTVDSSATLGGHGTINGHVDIAAGAHLTPGNSIGTLTINGGLSLAQGSVLDYEFGTPGATFTTAGLGDSVKVSGDLSLNGAVLNVSDAGGFGAGLYNLFSYGGTLRETNGGITFGTVPANTLSIQNLAGNKQINLLNTSGLTLNFWNGNGLASATQMGGGDGTWSVTSPNWTDATGSISAPMQPQPGFAIFGGAAGTVTVDNGTGAVSATGLQFASDGYTLVGNTLTLVGDNGAAPVIRVGNGSTAGAGYTATIANVLAGTDGLNKSDLGTLVLTAANTYTGGTTVSGGTLEIASGGTPGVGDVTVDNSAGMGSTLRVNSGASLTNLIVLSHGATLDNAGSITNTANGSAVWTNAGTGSGNVNNHDGGSITAGPNGVVFQNGGSITNAGAGSSITTTDTTGGGTVVVFGAPGLVSNTGGALIGSVGGGIGVQLSAGGTVTNDGTGSTITASGAGSRGVFSENGTGAVHNTGGATIHGDEVGVLLSNGGEVDNIASSSISGGSNSIVITNGAGSMRNTGTLFGNVTLDSNATNTVALSAGGSIAGNLDIGSNAASTLTLDGDNTAPQKYSDAVTGSTTFAGALAKSGNGTWIIDSDDLAQATGSTITAGTLQIGNGGNTGSLGGNVSNNGNLVFSRSDSVAFAGTISGIGSLAQNGNGVLTLTGANSYAGGTTINTGTLQGDSTSLQGNIIDNATLVFDQASNGTFAGVISGSGSLGKRGTGTLTLNGAHSYTGMTDVQGGTLLIGDSTHAGASIADSVQVDNGAILGGHGTIGGNVDIADGAHLAPGASIGTLTIGGNLSLAQGGQLDFEFGAPGANLTTSGTGDSVQVGGDLSLNGAVLNVSDAGGFGPGLYNLFSYGGTLTETRGGIGFGAVPAGSSLLIQNLTISKQINLLNISGMTLNLWNGNGVASATQMGGGSGTWSATAPNWTDATGSVTASMQPQPGFALFGGTAGTVTVDNGAGAVSATGLQFASDGYTLTGDTLTLVGDGGTASVIRVGDGSSTGAGYTATIANVLAGTDGLSKSDLGTLVLTAANTYSGGTTIDAGALQIGNGGTTGSVAGDVTNNGTLAFNRSDAVDFGGVISGTGSLQQNGSGVLTLTGANSYTGGTTINAGTLQGDSTSLQGDITDNAVLVFRQDSVGSFDGVVSGTGSLDKLGTGTLALTGANRYAGGTTITSGTLQIGNDGTTGSITGDVTDNGIFAFNRSDAVDFAGVVSGSGSLVQNGSGVLTLTGTNTYTGGTTINAGTLQGDSTSLQGNITDNGALVFNQAADGIFAGSLSGNGNLTKAGAGLLVFNGNSPFAGNTVVQTGTLEVGDAATPTAFLGGSVLVDSAAALRGHGTIGGNVVNNGNMWAGGSIGTLTVQGDYTQNTGSTFTIDVTPAGQASLLAVNGKATILGGSAVVLAAGGNWAPQTDYTVLTASDGVSGQFASASSSLLFLDPVLTYGASTVNLSLQRNDISFASIAQTSNQQAVATTADGLGFGNPVYAALTTLDAPTARHAFDQLSGVIHASTRTALLEDSRYVRDTVNRHLLGINNGAEAMTARGTSVWTSAWTHGGHDESDDNAPLLQANGSGLLLGADLPLGDTGRLGALAGHGQNSVRSDGVGQSTHVLADHAGVYVSGTFDAFTLRGGAIYSRQKVRSNRAVAFGNYSDRVTGEHHAQTAQAYVEGGYQFNASPGQQLEPFLNLARVRVHEDALQEAGGGAALAVASGSMSVNTATLGLRDTLVLDAAGGIRAHASLGWQQAWGDLTPTSTMRFAAGGDSFAITGIPVARHALVADLGINFKLAKNVSVDASYLGQFGSGMRDQGARMSLTVAF